MMPESEKPLTAVYSTIAPTSIVRDRTVLSVQGQQAHRSSHCKEPSKQKVEKITFTYICNYTLRKSMI